MKTRTTKQRARGYTAIEVLMALTVFAVGAAGVISMQRASIQGNVDARRLDSANSIARDWMERLRRDATLWTLPTNLSQTSIISKAIDGGWILPNYVCPSSTTTPNIGDGLCPSFDLFGRDLAQDNATNAGFCVHIRLDTVAKDSPGNADLVRAEVRVFWPRQINVAPPSAGFCTAGGMTSVNAANATQIYHFVHATTLLRKNPAQ